MEPFQDVNDTARTDGPEGVRKRSDRAKSGSNSRDQPKSKSGLNPWSAGRDPGFIPPRPWLMATQFCRGFLSTLIGPGAVGKSSLRLLQLIALALGKALSGHHVFGRYRVLLLSLEDDKKELLRRIKAALMHHGIAYPELDGWLFCDTPFGEKLALLKGGQPVTGQLTKDIREYIGDEKIDLVALDPLRNAHTLVENVSEQIAYVTDILVKMASDLNIAVDVPHHVRKGPPSAGDADAARGSTGLVTAARLNWTLTSMSPEEAQLFGIDPAERKSYVRLDQAKVNLLKGRADAEAWYRLVDVAIGNATPEYPHGDHVQAIEVWTPRDLWSGADTRLLNQILSELDAGFTDEHGNHQLYSRSGAATERAAWQVVQRAIPEKNEKQCRAIIKEWLKSGLLYDADYRDDTHRKTRSGMRVDAAKRPGTELRQ
jgi:hypothetical protein